MKKEKNKFEFQYYYKRWLCGLPILLFVFLLNIALTKILNGDIIFYLVTASITIILLTIYYKTTKESFIGIGYFYKKDNSIVIEIKDNKYILDDVREIMADVKKVYSNKFAVLYITTSKDKIKLFSKQLRIDEEFKDSSLYKIYEFIIENNNYLKNVEMFNEKVDYWLKNEEGIENGKNKKN